MELSSQRKAAITLAVITGICLTAMEATIVATVMPTIVGRLGGVSLYAWLVKHWRHATPGSGSPSWETRSATGCPDRARSRTPSTGPSSR